LDFSSRLRTAADLACRELLTARTAEGHWIGELSSSALATATAVCALAVVDRESRHRSPISNHPSPLEQGLDWLARHANPDGGWGDTTLSSSNLSTTTLCWAALGMMPGTGEKYRAVVRSAEKWLTERAGGITPERLAFAVIARYGKDRTFSVPILTMCAVSGRLGAGREAWKWVLPLPFELAAFPPRLFAALRLPVVSYALPALIAIGQARHHCLPTRNPFTRIVRNVTRARTLEVLARIQPMSGGFLEATPLTSFVTMNLAVSGQADHPVARKGIEFLRASQREDGSWPIDTNLATWLTTLSVNALAAGSELLLESDERAKIRGWLLKQQHREVHPYTNAAPGGWAWTDLSGGVPDADDTAGALLALWNLGEVDERVRAAATWGVTWLVNLQNSDGGIPTFCRGWTNLPFDRSSPDLTAHALRAWAVWLAELPPDLKARVSAAIERGIQYLTACQRSNGAWTPLWFGNQHAPGEGNFTYGTARVVAALQELLARSFAVPFRTVGRGGEWLLQAQSEAGAWSGFAGGPPSIEETALALGAISGLAALRSPTSHLAIGRLKEAIEKAAIWLAAKAEQGDLTRPAPIGFYFAKLWYYERLYPLIFAVGALNRTLGCLNRHAGSTVNDR